jgi:hypothetical protein
MIMAAATFALVSGVQAQSVGDVNNCSGNGSSAIGYIIFLTIIFLLFGGRKFFSWLLFMIFGPFIIALAVGFAFLVLAAVLGVLVGCAALWDALSKAPGAILYVCVALAVSGIAGWAVWHAEREGK